MKALLPLLLLSLTSGCATIVTHEDVDVSIECEPHGALVVITDQHGQEIFSGRTPTSVELEKGDGYFDGQDYTFTFSHPGYEDRAVMLETSVRGWYLFGNIVFGGVIGWFIVDPLTGAMWEMDDEVHAGLSPSASASI